MFFLVEIILLSLASRIFQMFIDTGEPVVAYFPPEGNAYIPFYLWLCWRIFQKSVRKETPARKGWFGAAFGFKLFFTFYMTYLLVTIYDYGDLHTYYRYPFWISRQFFEGNFDVEAIARGYFLRYEFNWTPTTMAAVGFTAVFMIFPPSLYGIALLSGTVIFVAWLVTYRTIEPHVQHPQLVFLAFFFVPSLTMQMGYLGKESYAFPFLAIMFVLMQRNASPIYKLAMATAIFYVRFYQGFFIGLAWLYAKVSFKRAFTVRGLPMLVVAGVVIFLIYAKAVSQLGGMGLTSLFQLATFLSVIYEGGTLVLKPLPFPLTYLQSFRPFPWEAHNVRALIVSLESFALLSVVVWLGVKRRRLLAPRLKRDPYFRFIFMYVAIQLFVFGYNDNMGDLARRKIYYLPLLVALVCYRKMEAPAPSAAAPAFPAAGGGARTPLPGAAPPGSAAPSPPA